RVGSVFKIQDNVCGVDLQNCRRRDLRDAQSRARGGAESRSKSCFPMHQQCRSSYVIHVYLLSVGKEILESMISFRWYNRKRATKAATFWYIFCLGENRLAMGGSSAEITAL